MYRQMIGYPDDWMGCMDAYIPRVNVYVHTWMYEGFNGCKARWMHTNLMNELIRGGNFISTGNNLKGFKLSYRGYI